MKFNRESEKERAKTFVHMQAEVPVMSKQDKFEAAILFACDELDEIEKFYNTFKHACSHLVIFQSIVKNPLDSGIRGLLDNTKEVITRTYTQEELDVMPHSVRLDVDAQQNERFTLLKKVAKEYMKKGEG